MTEELNDDDFERIVYDSVFDRRSTLSEEGKRQRLEDMTKEDFKESLSEYLGGFVSQKQEDFFNRVVDKFDKTFHPEKDELNGDDE